MPERARLMTARLGAAALLVAAAVPAVGVAAYVSSDAHSLHDPDHSLQQLDLLFLDQPLPEPVADALPPPDGRPRLLLVGDVEAPRVPQAQVVRVPDRLADLVGLRTDGGRVGPGYALVDDEGRLRYRTYDPGLADHGREVRVLVDGL